MVASFEYYYTTCFNRIENRIKATQHCISIMREKVLILKELNINKHIDILKVECF